MNKRLTKVFSFALIVLLALGEGSSLVHAVTEEATSSTAATEKALSEPETASSEEAIETSSSEEIKEETSSSSAEATTESTAEKSEEKENKKTKAKETRAANDPVNIPDPELNKWIRATLNVSYGLNLGIPDDEPVTEEHMEKLTTLKRGISGNAPISDLTGLEYAINLETIDFTRTGQYEEDQFTKLPDGFKKLTKLKKITFYCGALNNIDELKNHPTLEVFDATMNNLTSLEGLSGCKELLEVTIDGYPTYFYPQNGGVKNFKGLESATKLKKLSFKKCDHDEDTQRKLSETEASYEGFGLQSLEGLNCANTLEALYLEGHPGLHTLDGLQNYKQLKTLVVSGGQSYSGRSTSYDNPGEIDEAHFDPAIHTPTYHTRGLRGKNALAALSSCDALESVQLYKQAIEDISPLSGKSAIYYLNISYNLIDTLAPLKTTNNIKRLYAGHNLLTNLTGLENTPTLNYVNVAAQNSSATQMQQANILGGRVVLRGLLSDVTALNSTSLTEFHCGDNRLEDLSSLKNASKLVSLDASNNCLSDIKGDLDGCVSLNTVMFNHNEFVNFEDSGLTDAKDSLVSLYLQEQGCIKRNMGKLNSGKPRLETLKGLKQFTVLEYLNLNDNSITDNEMKYIPVCIGNLYINSNNLQSKAFETFTPNEFTRLSNISATHNHISDITPLEAFTNPISLYLTSQDITVPKHGGKVELKALPEVGVEVDVLKSNTGTGLSFKKETGSKDATYDVKSGTNILDLNDPNYDLYNKKAAPNFSYTGNTANFSSFTFNGVIRFDIDYDLDTEAEIDLVPTDINGNELTKIPQGGVIYWRGTLNSKDNRYLVKPDIKHDLEFKAHALMDPYEAPLDTQASEYVQGARVEINGKYVPTPNGIWSQVDALHNQINKNRVAKITIVTKVNDDAIPGDTVDLYFNAEGKNFKRVGVTKTVPIVAKVPEVLNLTAPERFDFGKANKASKKSETYGLSKKTHTPEEQADGFKVRVMDTMQATKRVDWKVVAKLSDLNNSKGTALKNASASPKLSLSDITLSKITDPGGTETATPITHGSTGNPTWEQTFDLTAGGSSVTLSKAPKADGSGTWDYTVPFDKVKLEVPSNINDQAGYTFKGKLTWTLDDTL